MRLIRRLLRWILAVCVGILFVMCIAYALGIFTQASIENFFKNISFESLVKLTE